MAVGVAERIRDAGTQWTAALQQFACRLRVAGPGIIQSFDPVEQTVKVQLALRENVWQQIGLNGLTPIFARRDVQVKELLHVPIVLPRAGIFSVTLPIQPGDECLVVFGDMQIDGWWQSGGGQNQIERRW